jgi:hypothetical protein
VRDLISSFGLPLIILLLVAFLSQYHELAFQDAQLSMILNEAMKALNLRFSFFFPSLVEFPMHDVRQCKKIPYDISNILKALRPFLFLPNMGWGIAYGSKDPVTKFTAEIIVQLTKVRYRDFKTRQEALAFLAQVDTALALAEEFKRLRNEVNA